MPIEPKRIEAAADILEASAGVWLTHRMARRLVEEMFEAAWPELASDPPTAWVAPWTPSDAMWAAADYWSFPIAYERARDAYTKEQT